MAKINAKTPLYISLGIAVLALVAMVIFTLFRTQTTGDTGTDEGTNWVPFIPIWIAVFVPLIANKKKETKPLNEKEQRLLLIVGAIALFLMLASFALVFLNIV